MGTGCRARKQVAHPTWDGDDAVFVVTYKDDHTCRSGGPEKAYWPCASPIHRGSPDKPALCQATSVTRSDLLPFSCSPSLSVLPAAGGFPVSNLADQSNSERALLSNCPAVPECGCDQLHHTSLPGTPPACPPGDSSSTLSNKRQKAGSSSVDIGGPLTSMETEELEVLNECMENASENSHLSGAKFVQFPCFQSVKDLEEECSKSDGQSSISKEIGSSVHMPLHLPTFDASRLEPIEKLDGNRLLLRLENTQLRQSIFVGVVIHSEVLEFYFFDTTDMAICVGVGLSQAKVVLHNDLSTIIEELSISDREVLDTWKPFLSDKSSHVVMKAEWGVEGMGQDRHVETFNTRGGESLSWLCGVGFGGSSRYVDETYDAREVSWPLLYDMALITLAANTPQCNETTGESSAGGSTSLQENIQSNLADKLHGKRNNVFSHGNFQDGGGSSDGDGDEDRFACNSNALEDDDPPVVLKVTVHPLTKHEILDTQVKPYGLDRASIAPELIFEFRKNHKCKRISIKTRTRLELASQMGVFRNPNLFGWYHTWIQISFGCEDTEGHPQNGRAAILRQNSCQILNRRTAYKYTIAKARVTSEANTRTRGGEAGLKLNNTLLGGIALHGSSSGSNMQQVARSNGEDIETTRESVCGGFSFSDHSSTESPARASFFLFYPLKGMNIWGDKEFLQGEGLFSTIEPSIEGTWIPLNGLDASPYLFKVGRSLKLHSRGSRRDDRVLNNEQEYVLPFYVNHAMSHLRSQRNKHIELSTTDQQCIPNVLMVGSVF